MKKPRIPQLSLSGNRVLLGVSYEARAITFAARSACHSDSDFRENPVFNLVSTWTDRHDQAMKVVLDHKGGFTGGLIVGDLDPREEEEWIGRLKGYLRVPCGQIAFPGCLVNVPPGNYAVEVLCYLNSETADHIIDDWRPKFERTNSQVLQPHPFLKREALGAYFRRTRPGLEFPPWLARICRDDPREDPGYEEEWEQRRRLERTASNAELASQETYVDLMIQLREVGRLPDAIPPQPGWPWELRKPPRCPLGVSCREFMAFRGDS